MINHDNTQDPQSNKADIMEQEHFSNDCHANILDGNHVHGLKNMVSLRRICQVTNKGQCMHYMMKLSSGGQ